MTLTSDAWPQEPGSSPVGLPEIFETKYDVLSRDRACAAPGCLVDFASMRAVDGDPVIFVGCRTVAIKKHLPTHMRHDEHAIDTHLEEDAIRIVGVVRFDSLHL